jgi:autotransporter-associated beta strand protein
VDHSGLAGGSFAAVANSIDVGAQGASGRLIVNGGQVLNDQPLFLGDGATANGTLQLNGGLVRASVVQPNGTPVSSTIYFNGGTLQAATNTTDFILSSALVQSGGAVIDDGGFGVALLTQSLQEDPSSTGGGLIKKGAGTLYLNSASGYTGATIVTNGTLAGVGTVGSPVIVAPLGRIGGGDVGAIGTLTINNTLTIQGGAAFRVDKTAGNRTSDQITGITTVNYGGALVITNTTSDATPLAVGDTFTLFNATTHNGNFSGIVGSPGPNLGYSFANGVLTVITNTVATNPTNITAMVVGNTLKLSWPADHKGWTLQTNAVGLTAPDAWFPYPGSTSVTNEDITLDVTKTNVFFRLVLP